MIMSKQIFLARLRLFAGDARGSLSVETAMIYPLLIFAYIATFVFFDAFRSQNVNLKAAYTISDMLSRQTEEVDMDYLNGLNKVFDYLTVSNTETWIRVSVINWSDDENKYRLEWSQATSGKASLVQADITDMADQIPVMADGDTLILMQTAMAYEPIFDVGLAARWYENLVLTRPRFAPRLNWKS